MNEGSAAYYAGITSSHTVSVLWITTEKQAVHAAKVVRAEPLAYNISVRWGNQDWYSAGW